MAKSKVKSLEKIDQNLQKIIDQHGLATDLSVAQVKQWVWEDGSDDFMTGYKRYAALCISHFQNAQSIDKLNQIMQVFNDCWNYYPHQSLNGKSPADVAQALGQAMGQETYIPQPILAAIQSNQFFNDFILFLRQVQKRPMALTDTGNLTLKEIDVLGKIFKHDFYHRDKSGVIMFPIRKENEVPYLLRIRQLARVMYLTYQRKSWLRLTRNGKGYLNNIDTTTQFIVMIKWYFDRCNWAYLHPFGGYNNNKPIAQSLQDNQTIFWHYFLDQKGQWINFDDFSKKIIEELRLKWYSFDGQNQLDSMQWIIERVLVTDLSLYGLVEYEKTLGKYGIASVNRFRSMPLGNYIFKRVLQEPL